ncbi:MAG TPA: TIM-barrel domain-containing protein [Rhodanobacteraceae bacterium]
MTARMRSIVAAAGVCLLGAAATALAAPPAATNVHVDSQGVQFQLGNDHVAISLDGAGVVHVQAVPDGATDKPTLVMDPKQASGVVAGARVHNDAGALTLASHRLVAVWHKQAGTLDVLDAAKHPLLQLDLAALAEGRVELEHASGQTFYGVGGRQIHKSVAAGIVRTGQQVAKAGRQGHSGAPFAWSAAGYGVLVDSNGAVFDIKPRHLQVAGLSKLAVDVYLMVGRPPQLFAELADLSGHAPLFPKWSMGFMNSQWGGNEQELLGILHTYRSKHIPIDNFIMDFNWKAWGQNDYGEFRWNTKNFPDGQSGRFAAMAGKLGVHLSGIMKPRVFVDTVEGRYATQHHLWYPHSEVFLDYFVHKPVRELDFDNPATRRWFGELAIKYGFDSGIRGWWNDEADVTDSNTNFLNMERALYDAQRAHSDLRVWSINRNFWLGSQRYAYGMWSGDINTGFKAMAMQRTRMLSAIDDGEMWWGMDGGGFNGHPSDENYARWIEFDAFAPIFRVHGTLDQRRQPWVYGPIAEKAAVHAIRLRYRLLPYIYSTAWHEHVDGVGLVRPLTFGWPDDTNVRNDVDAWMFGPWLLVSPVVKQGATRKQVYLPAGEWTGWSSGKVYAGGETVSVPVDAKTWMDIPLFIRAGAIIPTQPVMEYVGQHPVRTVTVEVFPATRATHFDYYADDGDTYAYAKGAYFLQALTTRRQANAIDFKVAAPTGSYKPALQNYLLAIHGGRADGVHINGAALAPAATLAALRQSAKSGWVAGHDRYGDVTWVKVPAGKAEAIAIQTGTP